MNISESLKKSTNCNDIEKVMKIVATFGGNEEDLIRIKAYIGNELRELGENFFRINFFFSIGIFKDFSSFLMEIFYHKKIPYHFNDYYPKKVLETVMKNLK